MHIFPERTATLPELNIKKDARLNIFVWIDSIFLPEYNAKRIKLISCSVYEKIVFKVNVPENKPGRVVYLY